MANSILTPTQVTRKALTVLHQKLNFIGSITRGYDDSFAQSGAKIGDTLKIRLPNQYKFRSGRVMDVQDTAESSVSLVVNNQGGTDMSFTSMDLTMSLDDFSERIIEPAMSVVASNIEAEVISYAYKTVYNQVNNTGAAATFAKALLGRKQLVDNLAPTNDRMVLLNTQDNVDLVDALKGLFNDQKTIGLQNKEGYLGRTAGFDWMENTLLPRHTRGSADASSTADTRTSTLPISATGVSSLTFSSGAGTVKKGDVFTIGNVFAVHPETKADTGVLQQFVATADVASVAGAVAFSPAIVLDGAKQNVVIPTTSATATVTFAGTASASHGISLAYQKGAFAFATADLIMPKGVDFAAREVLDGVSMRIVRQYDINNDSMPCRVDVAYGYTKLREQLATRLANN